METYEDRVIRLQERTKTAGWKGPGSVAVKKDTWATILKFEADCRGLGITRERPFISAGADGSLSLNWKKSPRSTLCIEVKEDGTYCWENENEDGNLFWSDNSSYKDALTSVIEFFRNVAYN